MGLLVQAVIFDLDDTLIETAVVYQATLREAIALCASAGLDISTAHDVFRDIEIEMIDQLGFAKERYPLSLARLGTTLAEQQNKTLDPALVKRLGQLGWDLYEFDHEVKVGAERVLRVLRFADYRLILVTKGDEEIQRAKLIRSGLAELFHEVYVLADKTPETWAEVARVAELRPHECFVIGDSVRSDINASIAAGFNAIHIPPPSEWFFEKAEPHAAAVVKTHLDDLLDVFRVQHLVRAEWTYRNQPERDLMRATNDDRMTMVQHHHLRTVMPDCPGLPYLFSFEEPNGALREIHAVFQKNFIALPGLGESHPSELPGDELTRVATRWFASNTSTEAIQKHRADLPTALCKKCSNRDECKQRMIRAGVRSGATP